VNSGTTENPSSPENIGSPADAPSSGSEISMTDSDKKLLEVELDYF